MTNKPTIPNEFRDSFGEFIENVVSVLEKGESKGYNTPLRKIVGREYCEGEAILKLVRWQKLNNDLDLFKAAAHIFLIYYDYMNEQKEDA